MGYSNVRGVDGSPEQVAAARRLGINGVEQGDVMETLAQAPDKALDCVVAFDLIEHFTKDELIGLVDEVRRVLKPGGRWIIHTPNAESPFGSRMLFGDFTHELAFTRTSVSQILLSSGFSKVGCHEDRPVPHGLKSVGRLILWQCIRAILRPLSGR
jgi:cyclopropane fatty-acyl-phospholipid synthase-like methyltransferase